jgi:hypothetical protein
MSSSSTGTTHLERSLIAHFRRVYVHLHLSARRAELDYLLDRLTTLLDLSDARLQLALYPASLPWGEERAKAHADIEVMDNIRRVSKGLKTSDRIYEAGSACGDMGWVLIRVGRKVEGELWCGFEGELGEIAWRVEEEERARAAWVAAEEEKRARARARLGVQVQVQAHRREVVEID